MMQLPSVLGQFRNTPLASVGGFVVALLLKAKKRQQIQLPTKIYQQKTYMMAGVIPVTTREQEQYMFEADVTTNPVEQGALLSDHVILRPVRIDLVFEVNNIPDSSAARALLGQLVDTWQNRQYIGLQTEHGQFNYMILRSINALNEAPEWGKLAFRASFQQVSPVSLDVQKYSPDKVKPTEKTKGKKTPKRATPATNGGQKSPTTLPLPPAPEGASAALRIVGGITSFLKSSSSVTR